MARGFCVPARMSTMATTSEIDLLRADTDGAIEYTDEQLGEILVAEGTHAMAARRIWRTKAATTASMVDVTESGSSRALGALHKQALTMAESFGKDEPAALAGNVKRTRRAVRR